jgi:hypothetical protein
MNHSRSVRPRLTDESLLPWNGCSSEDEGELPGVMSECVRANRDDNKFQNSTSTDVDPEVVSTKFGCRGLGGDRRSRPAPSPRPEILTLFNRWFKLVRAGCHPIAELSVAGYQDLLTCLIQEQGAEAQPVVQKRSSNDPKV